MGKNFFILVCLPLSMASMHNNLKKAIANGHLEEVERILEAHADKSKVSCETESLLESNPVDWEDIIKDATHLLACKKQSMNTLHNTNVYRRMAIGLASIGFGCYSIGSYFYNSAHSHKWGTVEKTIAELSAAGGLIIHGCDQLRLGITNHDSKQEHAKFAAIHKTLHLAKSSASAKEAHFLQ